MQQQIPLATIAEPSIWMHFITSWTHFITDSALVAQRAPLDAVDPLLVLPQVDELVEGLAARGAAERRGARVGEGVARQKLALQARLPDGKILQRSVAEP